MQSRTAYLLFWILLFALKPLETGLEFPEADELEPEAEVEEAVFTLIRAACLKQNIKSLKQSLTFQIKQYLKSVVGLYPPWFGQRFPISFTIMVEWVSVLKTEI